MIILMDNLMYTHTLCLEAAWIGGGWSKSNGMDWVEHAKRTPAGACEAHVEAIGPCSWECPTPSGHMAMGIGGATHYLSLPFPAPAPLVAYDAWLLLRLGSFPRPSLLYLTITSSSDFSSTGSMNYTTLQ